MYTPKFELLSFRTLPPQRKQTVLRAALEFLICADWNYILENPDLPALYDSNARYILKVRPGGLDSWQDIPQVLELGSGDCIASDSLVLTERGSIPIRLVEVGDRVMTRGGWQRVVKAGMVRTNAETCRLVTSSGREILATPEHRVWTANRDWTPISALKHGDELFEASADPSRHVISRVSEVMQGAPSDVYDLTVENWPEFFAGGILVHNCKDFACIDRDSKIRTEHGDKRIADISIGERVATRRGWRRVTNAACTRRDAETTRLVLSNGRALIGTADHMIFTRGRDWAALGELRIGDELLAHDGADGSRADAIVKINAIEAAGKRDVYDITVEDAHEFFAEGVLVHNCWRIAELRNQGYADVYPHVKVSYHEDPSGQEAMLTVYHIQVRIHDIIEDPSAILGMPSRVSYAELRGDPEVLERAVAAGQIAQPTAEEVDMFGGGYVPPNAMPFGATPNGYGVGMPFAMPNFFPQGAMPQGMYGLGGPQPFMMQAY